jgi:GT2 family glycosyltransferase
VSRLSTGVSVLLVAYRGDRWLPRCLQSLPAAAAGRLHLVLVDNGGNALDELDLDPFDAEILRTPAPLGFAEANNFALVNASRLEDVVLFLNQDTISPAGWIDACLEALSAAPGLGAVSPLLRSYADDRWDQGYRHSLAGVPCEDVPALGPVFETRRVPAAAMLVRGHVLARTGPFDPLFGSYYEDFDLCGRIRREGYSVGFVTGARVRHYSCSTTRDAVGRRWRARQIFRNRVIHRVREAGPSRWKALARHAAIQIPRRFARGWLREPHQFHLEPGVTLGAAMDLLRLAPRLASESRDRAHWREYLERIDWPPVSLRARADEEPASA